MGVTSIHSFDPGASSASWPDDQFRDAEITAVDFGHAVDYRYSSTQNPPQDGNQPRS
jgi:hypothetical protein